MRRVLVTGGSGFVGRAVVAALRLQGADVVVLSRSPEKAGLSAPSGVRFVKWSPPEAGSWHDEVAAADAIVHLAGAPVATRWSVAHKARIEASRVLSTAALVKSMGVAKTAPAVFICASAIGYYGSHRVDVVDENALPGDDFLAKVCVRWEDEATKAPSGVRTVRLRLGVVLGGGGGVVDAGLGAGLVLGPLGRGDNKLSWIHRQDVVAVVLRALADEAMHGPINVVAPVATTGRQLAVAMAGVTGRLRVPLPSFAARLALGEAFDAMTGSLEVNPSRLLAGGYRYRQRQLEDALRASLRRL